MRRILSFSATIASMSYLVSGCGSSSEGLGLSSASLSDLPSAASLAQSNASASSFNSARFSDSSFANRMLFDLQSTGTPVAFQTIAGSGSNVDKYIFGGLVATIKSATTSTTSAQAQQFFGQTTGGAGGMPACFNLQNVASNLGHLLDSSNTTCYLKNIASTSTSGITVSGADQATMFTQGAADTQIGMTVSNMSGGDGGPSTMKIYLTNYGTNTVGASTYKIQLDFCQSGTAAPMQEEIITFNRDTGAFSDTNTGSMGGGSSEQWNSLSAFIHKAASGSLEFDRAQDRTAEYYYANTSGGETFTSSGKMVIHYTNGADGLETWGKFGGSWGTQKTYGYSVFKGTKPSDLAIYDAGMNATFTNSWGGTTYTSSFSGNTAWDSTVGASGQYTAGTASSIVTGAIAAETVASDTFFSAAKPTTTVSSGFNCNTQSPGITATMDFSDANVLAIQTLCDASRQSSDMWQMCNTTDIMTAQQYSQSSGGFHN